MFCYNSVYCGTQLMLYSFIPVDLSADCRIRACPIYLPVLCIEPSISTYSLSLEETQSPCNSRSYSAVNSFDLTSSPFSSHHLTFFLLSLSHFTAVYFQSFFGIFLLSKYAKYVCCIWISKSRISYASSCGPCSFFSDILESCREGDIISFQ